MADSIPPVESKAGTPEEPVPLRQETLQGFLSKLDILLLPAIGYYLGFSYQRALLGAYGIPEMFVRVDATTMLVATSGALAFSYLIYMQFGWFLRLGYPEKDERTSSRRIDYYFALGGLVVLLRFVLDFPWSSPYVVAVAGFLGLSIVLDAIASLPFWKRPIVKPWDQYRAAANKFGRYFPYLVAVFLGGFLASALGTYAARSKVSYVGLKSRPNSVLVTVVDQKAICALFDPESLRPVFEFEVVDLSTKENDQFQPRKVGPLLFK